VADRLSRTNELIEDKSPEFRAMVERAYGSDPKTTSSELTYMGYWTIAAQLKIDHATGKL
jgi:hypothetical protein